MATKKLDIFQLLSHINQKDKHYYEKLTDEEIKAFSPLVTMRWMSGVYSTQQIVFINSLVNPFVFPFYKHKKLLYYLMTICGNKKRGQKFIWNKTKKNGSSYPTAVSTVCKYYGYSKKEATEALPILSNKNILEYAEELGEEKTIISKIKKELKNR